MRNGKKLAKLKKSCKIVKNHFFSMKIIHAHLKYIWNKSTKNLKETLKALREVDFTNYALPTIIVPVYKKWSRNGCVEKNDVNLLKFTFSVL